MKKETLIKRLKKVYENHEDELSEIPHYFLEIAYGDGDDEDYEALPIYAWDVGEEWCAVGDEKSVNFILDKMTTCKSVRFGVMDCTHDSYVNDCWTLAAYDESNNRLWFHNDIHEEIEDIKKQMKK